MIIKRMKLLNFRSYEALTLDLHERLVVLRGDNAQGKTNILEAIALMATGKSHRTNKDNEMVKWKSAGAYVMLELTKKKMDYKIELYIPEKKNKQIKINNKPISRIGELLGCLNIVMFSPEDLKIVKEGPSLRRRFLDVGISQINQSYFNAMVSYNHILDQRNALLKSQVSTGSHGLARQIMVWNRQIAETGVYIALCRKKYIDQLQYYANKNHHALSVNNESLMIHYLQSIPIDVERDCKNSAQEFTGNTVQREAFVQRYMTALEANFHTDIKRGFTTLGIHRDDLEIHINQVDVKIYGSQGQQRTAALALKLSELDIIKDDTNDAPVLLLDDVMSELDDTRQNHLAQAIQNYQTVITGTQFDKLEKKSAYDEYFVKNSTLQKVNH